MGKWLSDNYWKLTNLLLCILSLIIKLDIDPRTEQTTTLVKRATCDLGYLFWQVCSVPWLWWLGLQTGRHALRRASITFENHKNGLHVGIGAVECGAWRVRETWSKTTQGTLTTGWRPCSGLLVCDTERPSNVHHSSINESCQGR